MEDSGSCCIALGAGLMLVGVLLGLIWAWLAFFRRSKSPRNGMADSSGQVSVRRNQSGWSTSVVFLRLWFFILPEAIRSPVCFFVRLVSLSYVHALLWGKMLGGLNPSTDLLVGSTSQYGPVLTEVPSQLKMKQAHLHVVPVVPLSDQEEETHTLMQDSASPPSVSVGSSTIANHVQGWVNRDPIREISVCNTLALIV